MDNDLEEEEEENEMGKNFFLDFLVIKKFIEKLTLFYKN